MNKEEQLHAYNLEYLSHRLDKVGIDRKNVRMIFKEPIWFDEHEKHLSLCDLIVCLGDNTSVGIELKHSINRRMKAIEQLDQGARFSLKYAPHLAYTKGIFAIYSGYNIVYHEVIPYDRQKITG